MRLQKIHELGNLRNLNYNLKAGCKNIYIYIYALKHKTRETTFLSCKSFSRSINLDFIRLVRFKAISLLKGTVGRDPKLFLAKSF